jgi:hypothetical protein
MSVSDLKTDPVSLILSRSPCTTPGRPAKRQRWTLQEDTKVRFSFPLVQRTMNTIL